MWAHNNVYGNTPRQSSSHQPFSTVNTRTNHRMTSPSPQRLQTSDDAWEEDVIARLQELDELNAKLSKDNAMLKQSLSDVASTSERDITMLRRKLDDAAQERQRHQSDMQTIQTHLEQIVTEHQHEMANQHAEHKAQQEVLSASEARAHVELEDLRVQHTELLEKYNDQTQQLQTLTNKLKTIRQVHSKELQSSQEKIEELTQEKMRLSEDIRKRLGRVHSVEEESKQLHSQLTQSQATAAKYKEKLCEVAGLVEEAVQTPRRLMFASPHVTPPPNLDAFTSANATYNFREKLQSLSDALAQQCEENNRLRTQHATRERQFGDIIQQVQDYETLTAMLQNQLHKEIAAHENCGSTIADYEARVNQLSTLAQHQQTILTDFETLKKSHEECVVLLASTQKERDVLLGETQRLKEECSAHVKHSTDLNQELQQMRLDAKDYQMQKLVMEKEKESALIQLRSFGESKNALYHKQTKLAEQLRACQTENEKLRDETQHLREKMFKSDTGNTQKTSQIALQHEKMKTLSAELEKCRVILDDNVRQLKELIAERDTLKTKLESLQSKWKEITSRNEKLESQVASDAEQLLFLQNEVQCYQTKQQQNREKSAESFASPCHNSNGPKIVMSSANSYGSRGMSTTAASLSPPPSVPCSYFTLHGTRSSSKTTK
eukprot:PhF_6_TR40220/c0_g1_i1/m.59758